MFLTAPMQTDESPARDAAPAQAIPASFSWSDTAVARLRRLWADGRSAAQIAREIGGLSRAAVLGKARRLGLDSRRAATPRESGAISEGPRRIGTSRAEKGRRQRARATARRQALREQAHPEIAPPETPPSADRPCSLLELSRDTCRWPIGDPAAEGFHFCGALPDAGHPYCAHHRRIAHWRPAPSGSGTPGHSFSRVAKMVAS